MAGSGPQGGDVIEPDRSQEIGAVRDGVQHRDDGAASAAPFASGPQAVARAALLDRLARRDQELGLEP